ncbi:hypothetical protein PT974_10654 [Cladobotryum mycophilum]|uniref:Uncharacterized protein n=1 Tax=Cladobotryum mycophilum TaxID=491253 RepID=A0ABR0SAG3_9HYPO
MSQYLQLGATGMSAPGMGQPHLSTSNQPPFRYSSAPPLSSGSSGSVLGMASANQPRTPQAYMPHPNRALQEPSPLLVQQPMPQLRPTVEISDIRNECLTEADARKKLSTYIAVRLAKPQHNYLDDQGNLQKPTWERAESMTITDMSQPEIKSKLRRLKKDTGEERARSSVRVHNLPTGVDKQEDHLFVESSCGRQKEEWRQEVKGGSKSKPQKAHDYSSVTIYFKRAPRAEESSMRMLEEQSYARQQRWNLHGNAPSYPLSQPPAQQYPQHHFQPAFHSSSHPSPEAPSHFVSHYPTYPPLNNSRPVMSAPVPPQTLHMAPGITSTKNIAGVNGRDSFETRRSSFLSTSSDNTSSSDDTTDIAISESSEDSDPRYYSSARLGGTSAYRKDRDMIETFGVEAARSPSKHDQQDRVGSGPLRHGPRSPLTSSPKTSAFDAREVLHALADVIRGEGTRRQPSEQATVSSPLRSTQHPLNEHLARPQSNRHLPNDYGQVEGRHHRSQVESRVYRSPGLAREQAAQHGTGKPSWLFRGYLEDQDWELESGRHTGRQHDDREYTRRMRSERELDSDDPFRPLERQRGLDYFGRY